MSLASATEAPTGIEPSIENTAGDGDDNVLVVFEGADAFILDRSGMHRITEEALQRSPVLAELKEAPGTSTLPVSKRIFCMWLDLVATDADCSAWTHDSDLCSIAQIAEFLKDQSELNCATARLGNRLCSFIRQDASGQDTSDILQALASLHTELLTLVFAATDVKLATLLPAVPPAMHIALVRRHLRTVSDSLDISEQLHGAGAAAGAGDGDAVCPLFEMIAPVLAKMEPLRHFSARGVGLSAADMPALRDALDSHAATLHTLDIAGNPLGAAGAATLAPLLLRLPHLTALDLSGCGITARSAPQALAPALRAMPFLRRLNLARNRLSDLGMRVLCSVLWKLTSLEELRLGGNGLSRSLADLAPAVARMHALRVLDVSDNRSLWVPVAELIGAAMRLPCLEELDITQALAVRPKRLNQQANADAEIRELLEAGHHAFWAAHQQPLPAAAADADAAAAEAADAAEADEQAEPPQEEAAEEALPPGVIDIGILPGSLTANALAGVDEPMFRAASAEEAAAPAAEPVPTAPLKRLRMRNAAMHTNLFQRLCCAVTEKFVCSREVLALVHEPGQPHWTIAGHLTQLESLDISDIPIGNGPLMQMIPALQALPALRELHAVNCAMEPLGLHFFGNSMAPGEHRRGDAELTMLDWSENTVAEGSGRNMLDKVSALTGLQELRLRRCGIVAESAHTLAGALRPLRALRRLDLARNGLGAAGAAAVVAAAAELPELRYLHCGAGHGVDAAAVRMRAQLPERVVFALD